MFKTLLSRKHQRRPAQALVEFTLVALVFLFMVVMIIEVARILQAYVTIQHAAREAARYATTGQFEPKYGANPLAGWNETRHTAEPLQSIPPCWPLFHDDPYINAQPRLDTGAMSELLWQPYRDARTCSVEEAAIRNMAGLIMNPNANVGDPDFYGITVGGTSKDADPMTGTFLRGAAPSPYPPSFPSTPTGMVTRSYADYYDATGYGANFVDYYGRRWGAENIATTRGYAGDPGKKVQVQIEYNVRMITPLLSNIVRSVKLKATAVMTVESFGSTSLQRKAVPPPPDPDPLLNLSELTAADLYVASLTCPTTHPVTLAQLVPGDSIICTANIRNKGINSAPTSQLRVYRNKTTTPPNPLTFAFYDTLVGDVLTPDLPIDPLAGGDAETDSISIPVTFTEGGNYYIYVWADASTSGLPSEGSDGIIIEEDPNDSSRITNNLAVSNPVIPVVDSADVLIKEYLTPEVIPNNSAPDAGETITFTFTVRNDSVGSQAQGVTVSITPGADLSCSPCSFPLGTMAQSSETSPRLISNITVAPGAPNGTRTSTITVTSTSPTDPQPANNSVAVDITVGGVVLDVAKSVAPTTVDYNASAPSAVTYTVLVHNTSGIPASNIAVSDPLDNRLQYVSASVTPSGTCGLVGSTVSCTNIALDRDSGPAGDTATVTIQAQVKAATPAGTIPNTATASSLQSEDVTASADLVVRGVDIAVTKTTEGNITSALQGGQYIYIIQARNNGTLDAQNVNITDLLNTTYLGPAITATADVGSYTQASGLWAIGTLGAGSTATLRITVTVQATATVGATIPNTATLQAGVTPPETNPANNSASYPVTVSSLSADLALTKTVSPTGTVVSGTPLTYTVTLTNNSPSIPVTGRAVSDTTLRDALSSGRLRFVSATVSQGSFSGSTGQWTGIALAPGQTATATINVIAVGTRGTDVVFPNTANTVPGTIPDPASPGPNTATATIQINWPDPIFINAGGSGCNQVTWGSEDATLGNKNFDWAVEPNASWTRTDGVPSPLANLGNNRFILDNGNHVQAPAGQNLFGCRTLSGGLGNTFSYRFNNLVPGTWRLYLAFAEFEDNRINRRLLTVSADGTGSLQTLLDNFDIIQAIRATGVQSWVAHSGHWDIHYIIKSFDVTVNGQTYLGVQFSDLGAGGRRQAQINGLGIEYIQP